MLHNQRLYRILTAAALVGFLSLWHVRVSGHLPLNVLLAFLAFVFACWAYGRAFFLAASGVLENRAGASFQLMTGFFLFNSALFVLSLASPLGMALNVGVLLAIALILAGLKQKSIPVAAPPGSETASLICMLMSGLAATLWCTDSLRPLTIDGTDAIFQTWRDTFVHARHISAFAQAHGIATMSDMRLSDSAAQVYHFATYLTVAAISGLADVPAIAAYSSLLLPFGILLTGLGAFSLMASVLGAGPALAAAAAVVLIPDAFQQGFGNRYLGYNFIAQVNLGMLYGIACAAIAWIFVLESVRRKSLPCIVVAYVFLALSLLYKAHIFVANAYLILIYPCVFFPGIRLRWRVLVGLSFTLLYVAVVWVSQSIDRMPVMRLDGSGIGTYVLSLLKLFDPGPVVNFFGPLIKQRNPRALDAIYVSSMLLVATFGWWLVATPLTAAAAWRKLPRAVFWLPAIVVVNYLVMAMGLALDSRGVGTPDELLNRPLVWAYFVVAAWTGAVAYFVVCGSQLPGTTRGRLGLAAVLCLSTAGPLTFAPNLQTFPAAAHPSYKFFNSVPLCLVRAAEYVRDNSLPDDIIQVSDNDPYFVVTALAERQLFLGMGVFLGGRGTEREARATGLKSFLEMRTEQELQAYADKNRISWYILRAGTVVAWPKSFVDRAAFDCGGYRVYRFSRASQ